MKKLHLAFGITALLGMVAGLLHGGIAWAVAELTWKASETSFPTWGAFVLPLFFYGLGVLAVLLLWLITALIVHGIRNRGLQKSDADDII